MSSFIDEVESILLGWRDGVNILCDQCFPEESDVRDIMEMCAEVPFNANNYQLAMLALLDRGIVGMDRFKFCWPEVAHDSRKRTLACLARNR